jgi:hypothetical protein
MGSCDGRATSVSSRNRLEQDARGRVEAGSPRGARAGHVLRLIRGSAVVIATAAAGLLTLREHEEHDEQPVVRE